MVGNNRSELLKLLLNDKRCRLLIRLSIIEKLYLVRIIKPHEIDEIETMLMPHQKVKTNYGNFFQCYTLNALCINIIFKRFVGTTLLTETIAEHNIKSIRILYKTIKIESFGRLMGFEPHEAKLIAERMISEGRIEGSIDQIDGIIKFNRKSHFCSFYVL